MALESRRLRFERFSNKHTGPFVRLALTPAMTAKVATGERWTEERAFRTADLLATHWERRGFGAYALYLRDNDEFCGLVSLAATDRDWMIEVGWWIDTPYWGQGLATEAALTGYEVAVGLGAKAVVARCREDNLSSQRVAEKIGMVHAGWLPGGLPDSMLWLRLVALDGGADLALSFAGDTAADHH